MHNLLMEWNCACLTIKHHNIFHTIYVSFSQFLLGEKDGKINDKVNQTQKFSLQSRVVRQKGETMGRREELSKIHLKSR